MEHHWQDLLEDPGVFLSILGEPASPKSFRNLELVFRDGVLRLDIDGNTDQVIVSTRAHETSDLPDITDELSLSVVRQWEFGSFWMMRNDRGYLDGVQIEFVDCRGEDRPRHCIQFEVAASSFHVRTVSGWWH